MLAKGSKVAGGGQGFFPAAYTLIFAVPTSMPLMMTWMQGAVH